MNENNIKEYILNSGLKSRFIASKIGCSPSDISRWISGESRPNRKRLRDLSKLLKVPMYRLYNVDECCRKYIRKDSE